MGHEWHYRVIARRTRPIGFVRYSPLHRASRLRWIHTHGSFGLAGSSPKRKAFAKVRGGRHIGYLTAAFIATVREAGDAWTTLTWATVGHHVRERVIEALDMEGQWVNLAGPRSRRLFSREVADLAGTVSYVPAKEPGRGWLRAGWHQGVTVGDKWAVIGLCVDADGRGHELARGVVESVEVNRAELKLESTAVLPLGSPAHPVAVVSSMPVAASNDMLAEAIDASAWLHSTRCDAVAEATTHAGTIRVEPTDGSHLAVRLPNDASGRRRAVSLLEDHARVRRLMRSLGQKSTIATARPVGSALELEADGLLGAAP